MPHQPGNCRERLDAQMAGSSADVFWGYTRKMDCIVLMLASLISCPTCLLASFAGRGRRINKQPYLDFEATALTRFILPGGFPGHV